MAAKGQPKTGGRKKGTPNKITAVLTEAIELAAEQCGSDGKGKDGLVGYLRWMARQDTRAFGALLAKRLPALVNVKTEVDAVIRDYTGGARDGGDDEAQG